MEGLLHVSYYDDYNNLIKEFDIHNNLTTNGANYILNNFFRGFASSPNWYIGMISVSSESLGIHIDDTMASHEWTEYPDASGNRQRFFTSIADSSNLEVRSTSEVTFTLGFLGGVSMYGIFVTNKEAYNDNSGVLLSVSNFIGTEAPHVGYTLRVNYTYRM